jgi:hypothetical protein
MLLVVGVEFESERVVGGLYLCEFSEERKRDSVAGDYIETCDIDRYHNELSQYAITLCLTPLEKRRTMERALLFGREGGVR